MDAVLDDFQEYDAVQGQGYSYEETIGHGKYKSESKSSTGYKANVRMNNNEDIGVGTSSTNSPALTETGIRPLISSKRGKDSSGSESDDESVVDAPAKDLRYYDNSVTTRILKKSRYWFFERFGDDWIFLTILGVCAAFIGLSGDLFIETLSENRDKLLFVNDVVFVQYLLWVIYSITFVLFSIGFTHYVAPTAIGSGIPEMKTMLKGIDLFHYLSLRTLLAKFVGLCTALGAGLPLGKEGPSVHISSIIAHKLSKHVFKSIGRNEARRMEMLGAACAVGVSSNFGAPIGGVLFSIEVTSTYFAVRNYWRGFFAAVIAALLFRLFALFVKSENTITALFTTSFDEFPYDAQELIAFAIIGVIAGPIAAAFVWTHRKLIDVRKMLFDRYKFLSYNRYVYPAIVAFIFATLTFPKFIGHYMGLTQKQSIDELFSNEPLSSVGDWKTPSIFFSLIVFIVLKFFMTAIAVALPIPAGVFVPVFVIGAAYGRFMGELFSIMFPDGFQTNQAIIPGGYAVVGAAAFAAGVTHTISTSVIVFELTGQIHHILPVMIAVLISNAISQAMMPSFYDSIIQIKKLPYLPDLRKKKTYNITAGDIMNHDLFFINSKTTYGDIQRLLTRSNHRSYPIVDSDETMILIGSIRRDHLESMLAKQLARAIVDNRHTTISGLDRQESRRSTDSRSSSRNSSRAGSPTKEFDDQPESKETYITDGETAVRRSKFATLVSSANDDLDLEDSTIPVESLLQRKLELLREFVDLSGRRIDASPFQIVQRTSLHKVHTLFSLLGLTHAFVTSHGRIVGVITLKELRAAIEGTLEQEREEERRTQAKKSNSHTINF